jgi:hypothetical protein
MQVGAAATVLATSRLSKLATASLDRSLAAAADATEEQAVRDGAGSSGGDKRR